MIGNIIVLLALALSVGSMFFYTMANRDESKLKTARLLYHLMTMLVITASAYLFYLILTHQYQYHYVYGYSSNELPLGFLISTFWGGQEGSFMLWLLLTAIIGVFLQNYASKRENLEASLMPVFTLATTFLLIMISPFLKDPFAMLWSEITYVPLTKVNNAYLSIIGAFIENDALKVTPQLQQALSAAGVSMNEVVTNGKGLNPQLLNFWMQIHPPILFIGFAMATVPFAFAISAMIRNEYRDWVKYSLPWLLGGMGVLGLGIMLGGYWAYEMLGWGGYWAWDPVENSSLIPWLIGVASIHTFLVQKKSQANGGQGRFIKTNIILSILTYVLVLYSTFLTRSGVLGDASVHSFGKPGALVHYALMMFIGTFIILGLTLLIKRWKDLGNETLTEASTLSKELSLFFAAVILGASALIIFLGTSAPLFGTSVDTSFYDEMHIPIGIILGFANGLSLLLKWKENKKEAVIKKILPYLGVSVFVTIVIAALGGITNPLVILLTLSAVFTVAVNGEIAYKIVRGNLKMLGAYVAHIGIALFILGVIGSAIFTQHADIKLIKNKTEKAFGYTFAFEGAKSVEGGKTGFSVSIKNEGTTLHALPVMYFSDYTNSVVSEPYIVKTFTKDLYVTSMSYETGENESIAVVLEKGKLTEIDEHLKIVFNDFDFSEERMKAMRAGTDFEIPVLFSYIFNGQKKDFSLYLRNVNGKQELTSFDIKEENIKIALSKLDAMGMVEVHLTQLNQPNTPKEEVLHIQASTKPFIVFVWIGVGAMFIGFMISTFRRVKESVLKSNP